MRMKSSVVYGVVVSACAYSAAAADLLVPATGLDEESVTYDSGERTFDNISVVTNDANRKVRGYLTFAGTSKTTINNRLLFGSKYNSDTVDSHCEIEIRDSAVVNVLGSIRCSMSDFGGHDNLFLVSGGKLYCNQTASGQGQFGFWGLRNEVRFTGGETHLNYSEFKSGGHGYNYWTITGGDHYIERTSGGSLWMFSGYYASQLTVGGGSLTCGEMVYVGANWTTARADYLPAILSVTGGLMTVSRTGVGVANASHSPGRVELLGGTLKCPRIFGGTGSVCRGGIGGSALIANGGTLVENAEPNASRPYFIGDIDTACLGERGLVVDNSSFSNDLNQAFADLTENDVTQDGLLVKRGAAMLVCRVNSSHARTRIEAGSFRFLQPTASFGREMTVVGESTLDLRGTPTVFSCDRLVLGDETSAGVLALDAGDTVAVASPEGLVVENGLLDHPGITANGEYDVFTCASGLLSAASVRNLSVRNPAEGKAYRFRAVAADVGSKLVLVVGDYVVTDKSWTGEADGDWANDANWEPAGAPDSLSRVLVGDDAAHTSFTVSSALEAAEVNFTGSRAVTLGGEGPLTLGTAFSCACDAAVSVPVEVGGPVLTATVADGKTMRLDGALTGPLSVAFEKRGTGALALAADNGGYAGGWRFLSGAVGILDDAALGAANGAVGSLTVGHAVVHIPEGVSIATTRGLLLDAAGAEPPVATLRVEGDLVLTGSVYATEGVFAKTGCGTLSMTLPAGKDYAIAASSGEQTVPVNAVATNGQGLVTSKDGLLGFNVLEGKVVLRGAGATATTLSDGGKLTLVGGNFPATADPELHVAALTLSLGTYMEIGLRMPSTSANHPKLVLTEGAVVTAGDQFTFGGCGQVGLQYPGLYVTNAIFSCSGEANIPATTAYDRAHPQVRVGPGGRVEAKTFNVGNNVDIRIEGGTFCQTDTVKTFMYLCNGSQSSGTVAVGADGILDVLCIEGYNTQTAEGLNIDLEDGGCLNLRGTRTSCVAKPDVQGVRVAATGGAISVPSGATHMLAMPVRGTGVLTKRGEGTLVFGTCQKVTGSTMVNSVRVPTCEPSDIPTWQVAGGATVEAGTLDLNGRTIADFGVLGGAGTLANATLSGVTFRPQGSSAPTLSDVTVTGRLVVDFGRTAENPLVKGEEILVCSLDANASVDLSQVRVVNAGPDMTATLKVKGSVIVATACSKPGLLLYVR